MRITLLAVMALALLLASACNKDNKAAKDLDGTWKLESWTYAGNDTLPAGAAANVESFWVFAKCKNSRSNCEGHQNGFLGGAADEHFMWFFSNKGANFDMGGGSFTTGASMNQLSGSWTVSTLEEESFVITSSSCGSCSTLGASTVTFSRVD